MALAGEIAAAAMMADAAANESRIVRMIDAP
jgi:hypothetical protein